MTLNLAMAYKYVFKSNSYYYKLVFNKLKLLLTLDNN